MSVTVQLVKVVIKKTCYTTTNSLSPPLDGMWVGGMLFIWLQNYFYYPQNFQGKIKPKGEKLDFSSPGIAEDINAFLFSYSEFLEEKLLFDVCICIQNILAFHP